MKELIQRAAAWNAARYDRVFDLELTKKLLLEEYVEVLEAGNLADKVHELCDVSFVAAGVLWKLECEELDVQLVEACLSHALDLTDSPISPLFFISAFIDGMTYDNAKECAIIIQMLATGEMFGCGLEDEEVDACLLALCDSNDSKSVKKTASNVKANAGDKGPYYFSPKPKIMEIVEKANERNRNTN